MIPGSKGRKSDASLLAGGFLTLGLAKNMSKKVRIKESVGNMERIAQITRNTNETKINMTLNLDGSGKANIHTGIGFFDHMLNSFARHGFFDLDFTVDGDLGTISADAFFIPYCLADGLSQHNACILNGMT